MEALVVMTIIVYAILIYLIFLIRKAFRNEKTKRVADSNEAADLESSDDSGGGSKHIRYGIGDEIQYDREIIRHEIADYQTFKAVVENTKQRYCERCLSSGKRYDARNLGYAYGWSEGDVNTIGCDGCCWNDPLKFDNAMRDKQSTGSS